MERICSFKRSIQIDFETNNTHSDAGEDAMNTIWFADRLKRQAIEETVHSWNVQQGILRFFDVSFWASVLENSGAYTDLWSFFVLTLTLNVSVGDYTPEE